MVDLSRLSIDTGTGVTNATSEEQSSRALANQQATRGASQHQGVLELTVLSVYDLPASDDYPIAVSLVVPGCPPVRTGPPLAKHKDKNSFRFASSQATTPPNSASNEDVLRIVSPLPLLYKSKLKIFLLFADESKNMVAEFSLSSLRINESSWQILHLDFETKPATNDQPQPSLEPTIRLKMHLNGPYRSEIQALIQLGNAWFDMVDRGDDMIRPIFDPLLHIKFPATGHLVTVPFVVAVIAVSPVVIGLGIATLPMLLPLLVVLAVAGGSFGCVLAVLLASRREGREYLRHSKTMGFLDSLLSSRAGQTLIYDTGPRPSPVSVARQILPKSTWNKLAVSLVIDLIGSSSYLLPVVGEATDIAWAPVQTILIMAMYEPTSPWLKYVSFVEELLPFTDVCPSASIGWLVEFWLTVVDL